MDTAEGINAVDIFKADIVARGRAWQQFQADRATTDVSPGWWDDDSQKLSLVI
jgi:hypothetical protein